MSEKVSADKLLKTVFELFLKDLVEILNPELAMRLDLDRASLRNLSGRRTRRSEKWL